MEQIRKNLEKSRTGYSKPKLKRLGGVKNLTLKTGSISDFGGNKYTP